MAWSQAEFIKGLKRDIEKWKAELATSEFPEVVAGLNAWIAEGERMVTEYEAIHAKRA